MSLLVICLVAFLASALTFFSGFGLGTLLLPAFALFFPVEQAVALTGAVHFLNGLFKLALVGRHAHRDTVVRFGVPAVVAALLGAWLLTRLADLTPLAVWDGFGGSHAITWVKLVVGTLLLGFAAFEAVPALRDLAFGPRLLPLGGLLSGFFGGLAGMQGALRSAFLVRAGLSKEAFIGTGVVIAVLIDVSRLGIYSRALAHEVGQLNWPLLGAAVAAAFAGAWLGHRHLRKVTLRGIQRVVAVMLAIIACGLITGML